MKKLFNYKVVTDYLAIDDEANVKSSSKTWKVSAEDTPSAINQALANLDELIKSNLTPSARLMDLSIDCKIQATFKEVVKNFNKKVQAKVDGTFIPRATINEAAKKKAEEAKRSETPPPKPE